jgi:2-polyprenyl-3-methyl-5-hydroxy-6-metoxy-1,4-benzoquinol methylase
LPTNPALAERLAKRAAFVLGIDPDRNIRDNQLLTEKFEGTVENCDTERTFDVITMRNVAEHIEHPSTVVDRLALLAKPGGTVVILTPAKWAPVSIAARLTPLAAHHFFKRWLWRQRSTTRFSSIRLNTRKAIRLVRVQPVPRGLLCLRRRCRVFGRFKMLNYRSSQAPGGWGGSTALP